MKKRLIAAVAEASRTEIDKVEEIFNQSGIQGLMDKIILPIIVRPTGQDVRGWRIPDSFMSLMAEFGKFIYLTSPISYEILGEIALQRISCGAVLHEETPVWEALPHAYRKYSVAGDQPGLMSQPCWDFFAENAKVMLAYPKLHDHAAKIVRGIITHTTAGGDEIGLYMWGVDMKTEVKEAHLFCLDILDEMVEETFAQINAHNWRRYIGFMRRHTDDIDWDKLWNQLGISGLLKFKERRQVREEIIG